MEKGNIIILNGVSSTGKTTLAKKLQERLSHPYFYMDVDVFCLMSPDNKRFGFDDYSLQHDFVSNMAYVIKLFSDLSFNLIVPCVFLEGYPLFEKCVSVLHLYPVLLVHVTCPVEELRRREAVRGDRKIGDAEYMLSILVPQNTYDITIDTYKSSMDECADKIIDRLNSPDKFTAFDTLWS